MPPETFIILGTAAAAGALLWERTRTRKGRLLVAEWLRQHGYVPLTIERRWIRRGPFLLLTSRYQIVYRLEATDMRLEEARTGWARVGSFWFGMLTDQIEVRWDAAARTPDRSEPRRLVLAPADHTGLGPLPRPRAGLTATPRPAAP